MTTFIDALCKCLADILEVRTQRHEAAILKLMEPTTSWFGLRTTQLSREEAEKLHADSLEQRFIEVRGRRWEQEINALLALEAFGVDPATRASNELVNMLLEGGYL